jgi:hypothetical protein
MKRANEVDPIAVRVAVIATRLELPEDTRAAMQEVREAAAVFAASLESVFKKNKRDTGRAIASIDAVQLAKNIACDALLLPFAGENLPVREEK